MHRLYINGRFLVQRQTGVQRFAQEVVRAIDAGVGGGGSAWPGGEIVLVTPAGVATPPWLRAIRHVAAGRMGRGYAWEQFDLPRLAGDGVLLNLCNLAPLAKRREVVVLHDATTKACPDAFSRAFRLAYVVLVPLICRRADQLATVSKFSRVELARWYRIDQARLAVCSEGAEHILAEPADGAVLDRIGLRERRYFLAVGMGPANKNAPLLLAASRRAALPDTALVLTGRRSARVHGAAVADVPPGVVHAGHVPDAELRALYENALALVYPSAYEGFGLPPVEAMACGCPVIASDQAALREVGGDAVCRVPTGDVEALAAALARVGGDAGYRALLSERGRVRARRFRWSATADLLLAQCRAAAGQDSRAPTFPVGRAPEETGADYIKG